MSDPTTAPQTPDTVDLLAHIRFLQDALDNATPAEQALRRAEHQIAALQEQIEGLSAQIVDSHRRGEALERELHQFHHSLSWRITAPLRALRSMVRR